MFRIQSHIILAASLARLISIYCPPLYLTRHLCKQQVNPFSCTHGPHVSNQPKCKESPQIAPETDNSFSRPSLSAYLLNVPTLYLKSALTFFVLLLLKFPPNCCCSLNMAFGGNHLIPSSWISSYLLLGECHVFAWTGPICSSEHPFLTQQDSVMCRHAPLVSLTEFPRRLRAVIISAFTDRKKKVEVK